MVKLKSCLLLASGLFFSGTIFAQPHLSIYPSTWDIGWVDEGTKAWKNFHIYNSGDENLVVTDSRIQVRQSITYEYRILTGDFENQYIIENGGGAFTLAPDEDRNILIRFEPTSGGRKIASLYFVCNDPDLQQSIYTDILYDPPQETPASASMIAWVYFNFGNVSVGSYVEKTIISTGVSRFGPHGFWLEGPWAGMENYYSTEYHVSFPDGVVSELDLGETFRMIVRFQPTKTGILEADLLRWGNGMSPDEFLHFRGIGVSGDAPDISSNPESGSWGSVSIGESSGRTFIISNTGSQALHVSSSEITGTNAAEFNIHSGGGAFSLEPGSTYEIRVRFNPMSSGNKIASLSIASDDPDEGTFLVQLTAIGVSGEVFAMDIDGEKDEFYTDLTGPENGYIQIRSYAYNDVGAPDNDSDLSAKIWSAWSDEWLYIYAEVMDNVLSGNSNNVWENDCFELKVDPQPTSAEKSTWDTRLTALAAGTPGVVKEDNMNSLSASQKDWVRTVIPGGYALEMAVKWAAVTTQGETVDPEEGKTFGGVIYLQDNDGDAKRDATLMWAVELLDIAWSTPAYMGTVTFLPDHKLKFEARNYLTGILNPVPYDGSDYDRDDGQPKLSTNIVSGIFGSVNVGEYQETTIAVSNAGTADLTVTAAELTGTHAFEFSVISGTAPFTLSGGADHEIVIRFQPASGGIKNAFLSITSNDPDQNPFLIQLSGTGLEPGTADIESDPSSWDYSSVNTGENIDKTFVIRNAGDATLNVNTMSVLGTDASEFSIVSGGESCILTAGQFHNIVVRFGPSTAGNKTASLRIGSDDPDENPLLIELTGAGADVSAVGTECLPAVFGLAQNHPNPFNPATQILFSVPDPSEIRIAVFDLLGKCVRVLENKKLYPAGVHALEWDGLDDEGLSAASGIYIILLSNGSQTLTRKMIKME